MLGASLITVTLPLTSGCVVPLTKKCVTEAGAVQCACLFVVHMRESQITAVEPSVESYPNLSFPLLAEMLFPPLFFRDK